MIDYDTALQRLLAQARRLPAESSALAQAAGRILATDLTSPIALPSFNHAAMDGYALSAGEALAAGTEHAVRGSQAAGDAARGSLGGAWEIMTGARLPDGLDAVIAVERTELIEARPDGTPLRIRLREPLAAGRNVRLAGSDVAAGEAVLGAGTRIESAQLMLLAALGVAQVAVVRRPRVAVICTGKELQADLAQALRPGQIYNSNGPYLTAALAAWGAEVLSCDTVDDSAVTFGSTLRDAIDAGADLVISTGAVSMGRYDFVPDMLRQFNAELLFHKVAIRPGRPLLAARLDGGPLVVALPGTPMAVAAGLRFFVTPLLCAMTGQGGEPPLRAILDTPQQPKAGLRHFLRATLHQDAEGRWHATVASQQPYRIQPFAQADAWVVLGGDAGDCAAGTRVEVVGLECGASLSAGHPHHAQADRRGRP